MRVLGIRSGCARRQGIVENLDGAAPRLVDATDIPTVGTKAKERVDSRSAIGSSNTNPRTLLSSARKRCRSRNQAAASSMAARSARLRR
jgi:hypothetical protein